MATHRRQLTRKKRGGGLRKNLWRRTTRFGSRLVSAIRSRRQRQRQQRKAVSDDAELRRLGWSINDRCVSLIGDDTVGLNEGDVGTIIGPNYEDGNRVNVNFDDNKLVSMLAATQIVTLQNYEEMQKRKKAAAERAAAEKALAIQLAENDELKMKTNKLMTGELATKALAIQDKDQETKILTRSILDSRDRKAKLLELHENGVGWARTQLELDNSVLTGTIKKDSKEERTEKEKIYDLFIKGKILNKQVHANFEWKIVDPQTGKKEEYQYMIKDTEIDKYIGPSNFYAKLKTNISSLKKDTYVVVSYKNSILTLTNCSVQKMEIDLTHNQFKPSHNAINHDTNISSLDLTINIPKMKKGEIGPQNPGRFYERKQRARVLNDTSDGKTSFRKDQIVFVISTGDTDSQVEKYKDDDDDDSQTSYTIKNNKLEFIDKSRKIKFGTVLGYGGTRKKYKRKRHNKPCKYSRKNLNCKRHKHKRHKHKR
tara:strand:- start:2314 stop:3762 length:1449 start_codon:yes stop_codon:yes gene_type:complete